MPKAHYNKGVAVARGPIRTAIEPVRVLCEYMDEHSIPYDALEGQRAHGNIGRYRAGKRGMQVWTLIEWANALGFDIVAVPRQRPPQQGSTPATPQPGDRTHSGEGTAPAMRGRVGLAA